MKERDNMEQAQYNQYYLAIYVDLNSPVSDYEEVNNKLWDFIETELEPLHLNMVYDHGYGDWFDWFQVEFIDGDHTEELMAKLKTLSDMYNCDFCLAMKNGENEPGKEWYFENGELENTECYAPDEVFWAIESEFE